MHNAQRRTANTRESSLQQETKKWHACAVRHFTNLPKHGPIAHGWQHPLPPLHCTIGNCSVPATSKNTPDTTTFVRHPNTVSACGGAAHFSPCKGGPPFSSRHNRAVSQYLGLVPQRIPYTSTVPAPAALVNPLLMPHARYQPSTAQRPALPAPAPEPPARPPACAAAQRWPAACICAACLREGITTRYAPLSSPAANSGASSSNR